MTIWEVVFALSGAVTGAVIMASWQLHRDTKRTAAMTAAILDVPEDPPEAWEHKVASTLQHGVAGVKGMGLEGWQICAVAGKTAVFLKRRIPANKVHKP